MPLPRPQLQSSEELFGYNPYKEQAKKKEEKEEVKLSLWDRYAPDWAYENPTATAAGAGALGLGLMFSPTLRDIALKGGAAGAVGYGLYKGAPKAYEYAKEHPYRAAGIGTGAAALLSPTVREALLTLVPGAAAGAVGYGAYKMAPKAVEYAKEHPYRAAGAGLGAAALLSPTVRGALGSVAPVAGALGAGYGLYKAAPWIYENILAPIGGFFKGDEDDEEEDILDKMIAEDEAKEKKGGVVGALKRAGESIKGYAELQKAFGSKAVQTAGPVSTEYVPATGMDLSRMLTYIETGR